MSDTTNHPLHVNNILRICPFRFPVTYATTWYTIPSVPKFRVCNRCYSQKLASTPFAGHFVGRVEPAGEERFCNFSSPRIHALLTASLASNDFGPLETYIRTRVGFKKCPGTSAAKVDEAISWHKLDGIQGGLVACEACYNDFVVPSKARATLNTTYPMHAASIFQPGNQKWVCDLGSTIYAKRAARTAHSWPQLQQALYDVNKQPKCEGFSLVETNTRKWFRLRGGVIPDHSVCEACFREYAAASEMAVHWEPVPPAPPRPLGLPNWDRSKKMCMLAHPALNVAYLVAFVEKDIAVFVRAAAEVIASPDCKPDGIKDPSGDWYGLPQVSGKDFSVCGGCFAGLVKPWGTMNTVFARIPPPKASSESRVCDFNAQSSRFLTWIARLMEAIEKNEPQIFVDYAIKYGHVKPCPRSRPVDASEQKWWGGADYLACETCAMDTISGSVLEPMMQYKGTKGLPGMKKCDMYSPRVRGYWAEAMANPDPAAGLAQFSSKMQEREAVYLQTYLHVLNGIEQMKARTQNHVKKMQIASARQRLDIAMQMGQDVIFSYGGYNTVDRIGDHQHGFWATQDGYNAAQEMQSLFSAQPTSPQMIMQMEMLEAKWKEYE